jgi:ankyrin repeat protein
MKIIKDFVESFVIGGIFFVKRKQNDEQDKKPNKKQKTDQDSNSLIREIQKGDVDSSISLIKSGIFLNGKSKTGQTPLSVAARLGDLNVLKELINHKVDVKSSNFPMVEAIIAQHVEVVKFLVENGMNPNKQDLTTSPLFIACKNGFLSMVKYLLKLGCDPNEFEEKSKSTCLIESIKGNFIEIFEVLLEFGADVNQVDKLKRTPLHFAIQRQSFTFVKFLLNTDGELELFTHHATRLRDKKILEILIDSGFDINGQDTKGNSTLIIALQERNIEYVKLLLERGVNIYHVNEEKNNAMNFAIRHFELYKEIFMNGSQLETRNNNGYNIFQGYGDYETFKFLLENGFPFENVPQPLRLNPFFSVTSYLSEFMKTDAYTFQKPDFDFRDSTIPVKDLVYFCIVYNRFDIFKDLIWKVDNCD